MSTIARVATLLVLLALALVTAASAAPDEEALGKAEGYPICPPSLRVETRCLVGLVSRYDEVFAARRVARPSTTRALKRVAAEPVIRYAYQAQPAGQDDYLSRHRTTGPLILKDDTVLAERYQYDHAAGAAVPAQSHELLLRLRLPDVDRARPGAAVRAARPARAGRVRGSDVQARDGAHRRPRSRRCGRLRDDRTLAGRPEESGRTEPLIALDG
jgi:hypothetical protein